MAVDDEEELTIDDLEDDAGCAGCSLNSFSNSATDCLCAVTL